MARILGIDIPDEKRIVISLTYVQGIGTATAKKILAMAKIDESARTNTLTDTDIASIRGIVEKLELPVEGELRRIVSSHIKRLREIRSYRGDRHVRGLPARGQRTSRNSRTRKGRRKTVGGAQKKVAAKK